MLTYGHLELADNLFVKVGDNLLSSTNLEVMLQGMRATQVVLNLPFGLLPHTDMNCILCPLKLVPFTCPTIIMKEQNLKVL